MAIRSLWVGAEDADITRVAVTVTLEDLDGRRLPCAIGPQEGEDLAGLDLQVQAVDRSGGALDLGQPVDVHRCCHGSSQSSARLHRREPVGGHDVHRPVDAWQSAGG